MSEGQPILKDDSGRTIWLEAEDERWVSKELIEPGTWTFSATGEKTIYPTFDVEVTDGETTEVECVARLGYDIVLWMALPSAPGWGRARIRVEDPDGTLVHETEWLPREGLDPADRVSAKLTLPIGDVVITVETDTDVGATQSVTVPPFTAPVREIEIGGR